MSDDTLDIPEPGPETGPPSGQLAHPGYRIGPYRLLEPLGSGGMGEVWKAEQSEPVRRTVAIKLIKPGMDSERVLARFEAERQALALMDHPSIARVLDAGTTPEGRPYFAMEYVRGVSITRYCDQRRLGTRERLLLFQEVCRGVQHAHQKAVLHRDLKPGNILVADVDGKPRPKIIDFGVAKAMSQKLTDTTLHTMVGQLIGTPEYMSPEQAEVTNEDVDTRTDVYSLGVILYELLTGALPFDSKTLRGAGQEGIRRLIREQDPPRLPMRLTSLGDRTGAVAEARRTDIRHLRSDLAGDLDWIVMRALEKDRNRRFGSPQEFAQDIERHLRDEPVASGPPSAGYRLRKFVRRHRTGVSVGAAAVLALVVFAGMATYQAATIARERDRAEQAAAEAEAMNDFLTTTFMSADPWLSGNTDLTVVQALDAAAARVDTAFTDQPLLEARMHAVLGSTYSGLVRLPEAESQTRRAIALYTPELGPDALPLAEIWGGLAGIHRRRGAYDEGIKAAREQVRILRLHPDADPAELAEAYGRIARTAGDARRFALVDSALALRSVAVAAMGPDHRVLAADGLMIRASAAADTSFAVADSLNRIALGLWENLEPENPNIPVVRNNIGVLLLQQRKLDEAEPWFRETQGVTARIFGHDHPEYATTTENLANVVYLQGRYGESLALLDTVFDIRRRNLGPEDVNVTRTQLNVAVVASKSGDLERAYAIYDELVPQLLRQRGGDHEDVIRMYRNRAATLRDLERYEAARADLDTAIAMGERVFGADHHDTALSHSALALVLMREGRYRAAEQELLIAYPVLHKGLGDGHRTTQTALERLIEVYGQLGQPAAAARWQKILDDAG